MSRTAPVAPAILAVFVVSAVWMLGLVRPQVFIEDGMIETASAALFFLAAVAAMATMMVRWPGLSLIERVMVLFAGLLSIIAGLSEVSFGARLGIVSPPAMYGGGEFDGGHDIVILLVRLVRDGEMPLAATFLLALALVLLAGVITLGIARNWTRIISPILASHFLSCMLLAICSLSGAVVLDLDLVSHRYLRIMEETLEFTSAVLLVVGLASRMWEAPRLPMSRGAKAEAA